MANSTLHIGNGWEIGDYVTAPGGRSCVLEAQCNAAGTEDGTVPTWRVRFSSDLTKTSEFSEDELTFRSFSKGESRAMGATKPVVVEQSASGQVKAIEILKNEEDEQNEETDKNEKSAAEKKGGQGNTAEPKSYKVLYTRPASGGKVTLPYLYPKRPQWSAAGAKKLVTTDPVLKKLWPGKKKRDFEAQLPAIMTQLESDLLWKHACWLMHVYYPDGYASQKEGLTLAEYQTLFKKAGMQVGRGGFAAAGGKKMPFNELMQCCGQPQAAYPPRTDEYLGTLPDFVPLLCDHCHEYKRNDEILQCECGEFYCSAECRLADWEAGHRAMCAQALMMRGTAGQLDRAWLKANGISKDAEGRELSVEHGSGAATNLAGEDCSIM
eukprot:g7825.t1